MLAFGERRGKNKIPGEKPIRAEYHLVHRILGLFDQRVSIQRDSRIMDFNLFSIGRLHKNRTLTRDLSLTLFKIKSQFLLRGVRLRKEFSSNIIKRHNNENVNVDK